MSDSAIRMDGLVKRFGTTVAVNELTAGIDAGEIVGFLGPNGAGKTTTIRCLAGLLTPTSGRATVLGAALGGAPHLIRDLGYLPGDFRIDGRLRARDLFRLLRELRGAGGDRDASALCERLQLDPTIRASSLSKGNRQKIGIVQAFMHAPRVLILDEPTTGLDPLMQRTLLDLVAEHARAGAAVLFSSHALHEVDRVARRVLIIRHGKLVRDTGLAQLIAAARQRLTLRYETPPDVAALRGLAGVRDVSVDGVEATVTIDGAAGPVLALAAKAGTLLRVRSSGDELDDLFAALYEQGEGEA